MKKSKLALYTLSLTLGLSATVYALPEKKDIGSEKATKVAKKYVPKESQHIVTKLDETNYEIKFINYDKQEVYEIEVDAYTGKATTFESELLYGYDEKDDNKYVKGEEYTPEISKQKLEKMIKERYKGAEISEIKLTEDDGFWVYEIELKTKKLEGEIEVHPEKGMETERAFDFIIQGQKPDQGNENDVEALISENEANWNVYKLLPKGTNHVKTEYDKEDQTYKVTFEYKYYRIYGIVDGTNGDVVHIVAYVLDKYDEDDRNNYDETTTYRPYVTIKEAKEEINRVFPNAKIERIGLGEHELKWAYIAKISDDDYEALVVVDTEVQGIRYVNYNNKKLTENPVVPEKPEKPNKPGKPNKVLSYGEIKQLLKKEFPGIRILEIEKDYDDGKVIYEIEAEDNEYEYEIEMDGYSGKILEVSQDELDNDYDEDDDHDEEDD